MVGLRESSEGLEDVELRATRRFSCCQGGVLGRIRGTLKREPVLNPLRVLLNRDLIQRVYIPKGPLNPIP